MRSLNPLVKVTDMSATRILPRAIAIAVGACAALPVVALAQVTYFQRPPTADQLRAALVGPQVVTPAAQPLPSGTRTRGIVWNTAAMPAGTPSNAAASAAAPLPAAPRPAPQAYAAAGAGGMPAAALPINFDLGSSRVDPSSLPYIEAIASVLRSDPSLSLVIEGHTDDRGSYNRNMVLSWDRALGVFRTLVENYGIDPGRLQPVGKGPNDPMPGTLPSDGANRRVQFRVSG
jgi:outer membrane protein OmpA-like peptidoglycan-associated protein